MDNGSRAMHSLRLGTCGFGRMRCVPNEDTLCLGYPCHSTGDAHSPWAAGRLDLVKKSTITRWSLSRPVVTPAPWPAGMRKVGLSGGATPGAPPRPPPPPSEIHTRGRSRAAKQLWGQKRNFSTTHWWPVGKWESVESFRFPRSAARPSRPCSRTRTCTVKHTHTHPHTPAHTHRHAEARTKGTHIHRLARTLPHARARAQEPLKLESSSEKSFFSIWSAM